MTRRFTPQLQILEDRLSPDAAPWSYAWSPSPSVVFSDTGPSSYITLSTVPPGNRVGDAALTATRMNTFSAAPGAAPDGFFSTPFTLELQITDQESSSQGSVFFHGSFNGTLSSRSANVTPTFNDLVLPVSLGRHLYTISIGPIVAPGPPGSAIPGSIYAQVIVSSIGPPNSPPTADTGGPYVIAEGDGVTFDASLSSDPDGDPLTYSWDINGDGNFGDASGVMPSLSWAELAGLGIDGQATPYNVQVRVDDGINPAVDSPMGSLTVTNIAPTVSIAAPSIGVTEQSLSFTLSTTDLSSADQLSNFTFVIDWQDGNAAETVIGPSGTTVTHRFDAIGTFDVRVRATDKDGGESVEVMHPVSISNVLVSGSDLLVGGTIGNDAFTFTPGATSGTVVKRNGVTLGTYTPTGTITAYGGPGTDTVTVNGNGETNSFTLDLAQVTLNTLIHAGDNVEGWSVNGGGGSDTLINATPLESNWDITAQNAGNLNGAVFFTNIENLTGSANADVFHFADGFGVSGQIAGGAGVDELDYSAFTNAVSVNLQSGAATKTGGVSGIEQFTGGSAIDTLFGPNAENDWMLTAPNAGDVNAAYFYDSFENLTGGTGIDTFYLTSGAQQNNVKGSTGADVLDYSGFTGGPVSVDLAANSATGVATFANIASVVGSVANDALIGENANRTWLLTSVTAGSVGALEFLGFETLIGGSATDTFKVTPGVEFSGTVNGGAGIDKLDYGAYTTGVQVNLMLGTATALVGVAGVENLTGGDANDTLIGDAAANLINGGAGSDILAGGDGDDTINGGNGRDLLVGGNGTDVLHGNGTEDILIGGLLAYINESNGVVNQSALDALMTEWRRTDLNNAARIAHLNGSVSGGLNGSYLLNATTVFDDGLVDTLYGDGGADWFIAGTTDQIFQGTGDITMIV